MFYKPKLIRHEANSGLVSEKEKRLLNLRHSKRNQPQWGRGNKKKKTLKTEQNFSDLWDNIK